MSEWEFLVGESSSNDSVTMDNITDCPEALNNTHLRWMLALGECVSSPRLVAAFFIGLSSIACWLLAQAPQLITNCRTGKADKALSFWFLLQWFAGDATNLVGAILTKQLLTQIVTAVYFVFIDSLLMAQFVYYVYRNQGKKGLLNCFQCPKESSVLLLFPFLVCTIFLAGYPSLFFNDVAIGTSTRPLVGRALLSASNSPNPPVVDIHDVRDIIGYLLGCVSAGFYVLSRIPQIVKNFIRCSTEGLSLPMFVLAVMGNVTYALGVLLVSVEPVFILRKLPWLVGSLGTMFFDFTIFLQFSCFRCCCHGKEQRKRILSSSINERTALLNSAKEGEVKNDRGLVSPYPLAPEDEIISSYYTLPT